MIEWAFIFKKAVVGGLKDSWLRLNPTKMEFLWLGGGASDWGYNLPALDGVPLTPAKSIRSLGVTMDSSLNMEVQNTNIAF